MNKRYTGIKDTYKWKQDISKELIENKEKIVNMFKKEEKTMVEIAEEFGVCPSTIYQFLIRNKTIVPRRSREGELLIYPIERKKDKKILPFNERISSELKAILARNSGINNGPGGIKRYNYDTHEKEEKIMVGNVVEMKETMLQPKK